MSNAKRKILVVAVLLCLCFSSVSLAQEVETTVTDPVIEETAAPEVVEEPAAEPQTEAPAVAQEVTPAESQEEAPIITEEPKLESSDGASPEEALTEDVTVYTVGSEADANSSEETSAPEETVATSQEATANPTDTAAPDETVTPAETSASTETPAATETATVGPTATPEATPEVTDAPAPIVRSVSIDMQIPDHLQLGDTVILTATLSGYDGLDVALQWQYTYDGKTWYDAQGAGSDSLVYAFQVSEKTAGTAWRLAVTVL